MVCESEDRIRLERSSFFCHRDRTITSHCTDVPKSERVTCAQWRMLGHNLRNENNSYAQLAFLFAVKSQLVRGS